jgi:hypothetical protein
MVFRVVMRGAPAVVIKEENKSPLFEGYARFGSRQIVAAVGDRMQPARRRVKPLMKVKTNSRMNLFGGLDLGKADFFGFILAAGSLILHTIAKISLVETGITLRED